MQTLVATLHQYPEVALFLTLALGFWFGSLKLGSFSLGAVTSTLIVGLLVGQLHVRIDPVVQDTFFMMFLFAVGYSVGPVFIPALKKDGLPQIAFALIVCSTGLATAYTAAKILGYDPALAAGLLAGGYTNSGTLGVATTNLSQLGLDPQRTASMAGLVAIAYAVTYPFGTVGAAWFLSSLAPKLLGIDLARECEQYEARMGGPVQGRWCYPIERGFKSLRKKCRNKARIEASMSEAYIIEEASNFTTSYYNEKLPSVHNPPSRYNADDNECNLSLFRGQLGSTVAASDAPPSAPALRHCPKGEQV